MPMKKSNTTIIEKALAELLQKEDISTQEAIATRLRKMNVSVKQPKISRLVKKGFITKVGNYYRLSKKSREKFYLSRLSDTLKACHGRRYPQTFTLAFTVENGYEKVLCIQLKETFPMLIVGTIAGDGIILVITDSEEKRDKLSEKISNLPCFC